MRGRRFICGLTVMALAAAGVSALQHAASGEMTLEEALKVLNDSPWARTRTATLVISGVGSGEYGEKEIFSRYYVRLLSAPPIQKAYTRVRQILNAGEDSEPAPPVVVPDSDHLVIGLAFRSNHPDFERRIHNVLQSLTPESLRNRTYLSTESFPQLQPVAFFPPSDNAVGAQFVFPTWVEGRPVISDQDKSFAFEIDLPETEEQWRVIFPVTDEVISRREAVRDGRREAAVSEFRISSASSTGVHLASARFAGEINLFPTQQTGRAFHGSVYEYHRNDNLDARNFFDPLGEPLPEFKRNQFGGSLGVELGPRFSLFGSYDGLRIIRGSTLLSNVPTAAMKGGDFSELLLQESPVRLLDPETRRPFPGNRIPPDRIHPVARNLLALLPDPNRDETVRNFVNSQPFIENQDTFAFRADLGLEDQSQLTVRYSMSRSDGVDVHPWPRFGSRPEAKAYEAVMSYTRTFGENTAATWQVEFEREEELETASSARPPGLLDSIGIQGVTVFGPEDEGYPAFEVEGYPGFGDEDLPSREVDNEYSVGGDLEIASGDHVISVSGDLGWHQLNDSRSNAPSRGEFSFSGVYSGHAFADFLLGRSDQAARAVGSSRQDLRSYNFELGVVDEWRVSSRMSLTLGLGYEYQAPYRSNRSNLSVFRPFLFEPPAQGELIDLSGDSSISTVVRPDRDNFRIPLALAYRPLGNSRFVLRASYLLNHGGVPAWIFENFMGRNFPHYFRQLSQAAVDSTGLDIGAPFDTKTPIELSVRDIDPNLKTPRWHEWSLTLQNEFSNEWSLELAYRGRRGLQQRRTLPANVPLPGPGAIQSRRPNPEFGQFALVTSSGSSKSHQLEGKLSRRFAGGLAFDTSFRWLRSFDDDFEDDPSNPRNLAAEWGLETGSGVHFTLDFIYDLPFGQGRRWGEIPGLDFLVGGWRLSGISRISTGPPFAVRLRGDPNNDGLSNDRPDRLAAGTLPSNQRSIDRWFETGAFAEPAPYSFGDAGRSILFAPGYHNWDLSLVKDFLFQGGQRLQVRFAFFNAFNRPNFDSPGRVVGTSNFGVISGAERAREIEIALKYSF